MPPLVVKYNVADANNPIQLYYYYAEEGEEDYWVRGVDMFTNVEIDGVDVPIADLDAASGQTQFSVGEHTVKYTLKDPTFIGAEFDKQTGMPTRTSAAFNGCVNITSIEIPKSVTSIGGSAFFECTGLTSVTIPNSVTSIGSESFRGCSSLTSVAIPNSVTSIGRWAFRGCSSLTSVTIPNSVTSIGIEAFCWCDGLTSITIPDSVTSIEGGLLWGCSSLTSVTIPNSVTNIGGSAFSGCTGLTSVTIPSSVTSIGDFVFYDCSSLTNIISLATTAPTITYGTFQNIKTNGTLTVPSGSTGYDVWMGTGNYYLGMYGWTKVEQ